MHPTQRQIYKRPLVKTARIELKCKPSEKDAIYAHAALMGLSVTDWMVKTAMKVIADAQVVSHE